MKHFKKDHRVKIQHAKTLKGEKRIQYMDSQGRKRHYMLDGYYVDEEGREHALEFNRCWYHGCTQCFPSDRDNICIQGKSLSQRYVETFRKKRTLEELGYLVHKTRACKFSQFERVCSTEDMTATTPLNMRDAYFSGCTNAITLIKVFTNTEKGGYLDFCSLYPTVLKYEKIPHEVIP